MNTAKFEESILACRYCFMCRHLSGTGNVTFRESDTPRVRAAMVYSLRFDKSILAQPDFIKTMFDADLSAACRFHCVSHYDENGILLAARQDIAEAGLLPENVKNVAEAYKNPAPFSTEGKGKVLFYQDRYTAELPAIAAAFQKIAAKAGVEFMTAKGSCVGKVNKVLGLVPAAKEQAKKFADAMNATGAETIVVTNPAAYDAMVNDFKEYGVKLNAKVVHTSEFLAGLDVKYAASAKEVYYLESDFLKNYNDNYKFPRELLAKTGAAVKQFGTNNEESYTCGEGALVLNQLNPCIVKRMAQYVADRADHAATDVILTASPYTKLVLAKETKLNVMTLEEFAASRLA